MSNYINNLIEVNKSLPIVDRNKTKFKKVIIVIFK